MQTAQESFLVSHDVCFAYVGPRSRPSSYIVTVTPAPPLQRCSPTQAQHRMDSRQLWSDLDRSPLRAQHRLQLAEYLGADAATIMRSVARSAKLAGMNGAGGTPHACDSPQSETQTPHAANGAIC